MLNQDPEFVKGILLTQIQNVHSSLIAAYPNNGLKEQLTTGTRYNGNGKVDAYLSFSPTSGALGESIDLTFSLACKGSNAIFSSEIAWSDGKVIDEVVVCNMCPECLEELGDRIGDVSGKNQDALVERLVELLGNFHRY
ncbi:MAG: hypothetical protein AB1894_22355 [Chloroflexota bacterium]